MTSAHQHLVLLAGAQSFGQGLDGLGLVAGGFEGTDQLEHTAAPDRRYLCAGHACPA